MFSLFFAFSVIFTAVSASCKPGEYEINKICCPMCNAGSVVKIHCTPTSPSIVCVPCVDGTFIDHPNGLTKCSKCTECDAGAGLWEVKKCKYNSNTECECKPGYHCLSEETPCDLCSPHTICPPEQFVKKQGTSTSDNVCEYCLPGYFSTSYMSQTCTPWTECSKQDRVQAEPGTRRSDSVCVDARRRLGIVVAFIAIIVAIVALFIRQKRIPKQENVPRTNHQSPDSFKPVQETRPEDE